MSSPALDSTIRKGEAGLTSELLSSQEDEVIFRKDRKRSKSGLSDQAIGERLDQEETLTLLDSPNKITLGSPRKRSASDQVQIYLSFIVDTGEQGGRTPKSVRSSVDSPSGYRRPASKREEEEDLRKALELSTQAQGELPGASQGSLDMFALESDTDSTSQEEEVEQLHITCLVTCRMLGKGFNNINFN